MNLEYKEDFYDDAIILKCDKCNYEDIGFRRNIGDDCPECKQQQVKVEPEVKPACEFTQEHFSIVGRAVEKWMKQDLVAEGKDMIGKKEGAKTLMERINEELSKSV